MKLTFTLANRKWRVKFVKRRTHARRLGEWEKCSPDELDGLSDPNTATIYIADDLPPEMTEHVYYHELVHALKYARGELDHDEVEVDGLGALLHQYMQNAK